MNQSHKKILVNGFTILRIVGIPFLFLIESQIGVFLFASFLFITDFLDGYLARKLKATTTTGAVLDLIADKLLVIILLAVALNAGYVSWILFLLISFREISSMVTRFNHFRKEKQLINASLLGKTKTTLQFLSLAMMTLTIPGYKILLWIVVILSYYSYFEYIGISKKGE